MNEQELATRITAIEEKLEAVLVAVERVRKYFLWILWGSVAIFVLPLIGLVFAIPAFLSIYDSFGTL
ncbi:MAG: hypothetical protein A2408_02145 [Candidatus Yonathbacteria bacterium RIFOXYC1_FULL_52_10]|uniref:Uncharacterized protein n=1 Tax=Candidatus Yonathbacteria bacterium RIFOXYD1_FULL_52_36 TaxID=1802730 RepID=A0A1G2SLT2_9BACT|nr:MAG: hypothetical protein A2408_02145 [Candidatus Yonathbacteria bacterium RIFOXYC1_FULL_52_10]OHA86053.1 MAG: hypothetical protein A2591_01515 [Candidatus Yonathbacteria bacterium RIFOXYD1_FULL_52_36]